MQHGKSEKLALSIQKNKQTKSRFNPTLQPQGQGRFATLIIVCLHGLQFDQKFNHL